MTASHGSSASYSVNHPPASTRPIDGLIFDLDGVLTDTNRLHFESWSRLAQEENLLPFTQEDYDAMRGLSRQDGFRRILKGQEVDQQTAAAWMDRKNHYFRTLMQSLSPDDILPGVLEWMAAARDIGIAVGLGSASRNARDVLVHLQLDQAFDAIGDGNTVTHIKPAPDIFLWVAGRMNVSPKRILVIEDSAAGVQAALAGGFLVTGVGVEALVSGAHLYTPTLADLSFESACQRLVQMQG
jgi:beta-phosphoglucomutase